MLILRLFLTLVGGIVLLFSMAFLWNHPPFFDPPGFKQRIKTYLTTNIAETSLNAAYPELQLPFYSVDIKKLMLVVQKSITDMGWEIAKVDARSGTIHAVVTTPIWRFKDDVVIRIEEIKPTLCALHIRSQSRIGKGDLGANIRHVMNLVNTVNINLIKEPSTQPGS